MIRTSGPGNRIQQIVQEPRKSMGSALSTVRTLPAAGVLNASGMTFSRVRGLVAANTGKAALFFATLCAAQPASANFIQNGGFETGATSPWVFKDWNLDPTPGNAFTGSFSAKTDCVGAAWRKGEGLKSIGRVFGKSSSSIFAHICPTGGIRPLPSVKAASLRRAAICGKLAGLVWIS